MTSGDAAARCDNCGEAAGPRFCPHCGQELEPRQGPLLAVCREALSDWLSLDGRLLCSLRALVRPGRLSELYLGGKRAPFLRPFRLYLVASLLLFSTLLTLEAPDAAGVDIYIGGELVAEAAESPAGSQLQLLQDRTLLGRLSIALYGDRIDRLRELPPQQVVDMLFAGLRRMLPLTLILFVPFLALALKLLYLRGRARHGLYLEHLVFALHYQAALFLALSAAWLIGWIARLPFGPSVFVYLAAGLVMLVVYLPLALRRFYGQPRRWTAVKTLVLLVLYSQLMSGVVGLSVTAAIWRV